MIVPFIPKIKVREGVKYALLFEGDAVATVKTGDSVVPRSIVLKGNESIVLQAINLSQELGVAPSQVAKFMVKDDGEIVDEGELVARRSIAAGTVERLVYSSFSGKLSFDRLASGVLEVRSPFTETEVLARVHGKVERIFPEQFHKREIHISVNAFSTRPFMILGNYVAAPLRFLKEGNAVYRARDVDSSCEGAVVVVGRSLSVALYDALLSAGAKGIVVGGIQKTELSAFAEPAIPLVITEGWGIIPVNEVLWSVLKEHEEDICIVNPYEKILAITPSSSVPTVSKDESLINAGITVIELHKGQQVQVRDLPYWGYTGKVIDILEDEGLVQVLIGEELKVLVGSGAIIAIGEE